MLLSLFASRSRYFCSNSSSRFTSIQLIRLELRQKNVKDASLLKNLTRMMPILTLMLVLSVRLLETLLIEQKNASLPKLKKRFFVSLVTLELNLKISMPTKKRFVKMPSKESRPLRTIKKHNSKKETPNRLYLRSKRRRSKN